MSTLEVFVQLEGEYVPVEKVSEKFTSLRTSLTAALEREKDLELKVELLRDVLEATRARGQQLVEELSVAVEALEGCWARLKTDRELVQKYAALGKVYDGLVEDAESALVAARAVVKP